MDVSGYVKYDIDYPEGWTVEFDGTKMSVTAPAAPSEWNQTPFDEYGLIKIWLYDNKGDVDVVKSDMALNPNNYNYTRVPYSTLTDNTLEITGLSFSQDYILIGSVASGDESKGYTLSANYFETEFSTPAPAIIGTEDTGYADMLPEISEPTYETSYGSTYGKVTVTPAAGTATCYYYATTTALDESDTAALVSQITSNGNGYSSTEPFEINRYMYTTVYVYITWTDAEGNYYAPVKVEIPMPA